MNIFDEMKELYADVLVKEVEEQIEKEQLTEKEKAEEIRKHKEFCDKMMKLVKEKYF